MALHHKRKAPALQVYQPPLKAKRMRHLALQAAAEDDFVEHELQKPWKPAAHAPSGSKKLIISSNGDDDCEYDFAHPATCPVCPRRFISKKALYGHMRLHPDRPWRGSLPPETLNLLKEAGAAADRHSQTSTSPVEATPTSTLDYPCSSDEEGMARNPRFSLTLEEGANIMLSFARDFMPTSRPPLPEHIAVDTPQSCDGAVVIHMQTFSCKFCPRSFKSFQALGGHMASHGKLKSSTTTKQRTSPSHPQLGAEVNLETSHIAGMGHECSICHRVFATGQALGGHKRMHWVGLDKAQAQLANEYQAKASKLGDGNASHISMESENKSSERGCNEGNGSESTRTVEACEENGETLTSNDGKEIGLMDRDGLFGFDLNLPPPMEDESEQC
ncbi:hypothetical protein L7F22_058926 [Adiantum nelumboides]|nr:hypothetical protein [Adiantum nelumboides]